MTRILVVDDEPQLLRALRINLRARGYDVDVAADGVGALRTAAAQPPDLVVLDLGLPDMDGVEVIHGLRGWTTTPIIVLSGRSGSADKVEALDAGADDYITKPFGVDELLARIRAATRRAAPAGYPRWRSASTLSTSPRGLVYDRRRNAGAADSHGMAHLGDPGPQPGQAGQPAPAARPRCGDRPTPTKPTTCASTSLNCAASSRTIPRRPQHLITEPGIGYRLQISSHPVANQPSNTRD